MPERRQPEKYRCPHCYHSLSAEQAECHACHRAVDLALAAHAAERYNRKRNLYYTSLRRKAIVQQVALTILLGAVVVAVLMLLDRLR